MFALLVALTVSNFVNLLDPDYFARFGERQAGAVYAVPTPFPTWNRWCGGDGGCEGLARKWLVTVGGNAKQGKALSLDTPLPTPSGWVTMGEIAIGDTLFDERGQLCVVTFATEVMEDRRCYRVTFSDGSDVVADANHEWVCHRRYTAKRPKPHSAVQVVKRTTEGLRADLHMSGGRARYSIPVADPLVLPHADLPVSPYLLGYWLGDGSSSSGEITIGDDDAPEILRIFNELGIRAKKLANPLQYAIGTQRGRPSGATLDYDTAVTIRQSPRPQKDLAREHGVSTGTVSMIKAGRVWRERPPQPSLYMQLKDAGLLQNKHIPQPYLRASHGQRMALLRGLMDSDGYCDKRGNSEYTTASRVLADGVYELMRTLGYAPRWREDRARLRGRDFGPRYRIRIRAYQEDSIFLLRRKADRLPPRPEGGQQRRAGHRSIVAVEPIPSVPVRCIQVSSPSSLYLAGGAMVPTHNTLMALNLAHAAIRHGQRVGFMSLEMSDPELASRFYAMLGRVPVYKLQKGKHFSRDALDEVVEVAMHVGDYETGVPTLYVNEDPIFDLDRLLEHMQAMREEEGVRWYIVDYLQLVSMEDDDGAVRTVTRAVKELRRFAKLTDSVVVVLSQFKRSVSEDYTQSPMPQGLFGGGAIEQTSDQIILLDHSLRTYDRERRLAQTWLLVTNRHGQHGRIAVEWNYKDLTMREALDDEVGRWPTRDKKARRNSK